jgi:predicted ATPase
MKAALARHDEILRAAIATHGGHVVKTTGDGFHAAFASASSAVLVARDAQRALGAEEWPSTGPLRVRMGLHTCQAELRDGDYYGSAVNRAARLMSVAHGGQVVLSLATEELAREGAPKETSFLDLGEHRLRDLSHVEHVFQLCAPGLASDFPPLQSLDSFPGNLPRQLTSFVGREDDLPAIAAALSRGQLVTITGVGGVGKTRLAIQVAAHVAPEFPQGVWLCELAGVNDDDAVVQLVATVLGVEPRGGLSLDANIVDVLRTRRLLLVLDNCEHVLDATARLVTTVLRGCPDVRVIATSREGLAVEGEQVRPLMSLPVPSPDQAPETTAEVDAVRLFVDRAEMARANFTLDRTNTGAVVEICRRLDGIPLAIELAAARVSSMRPADIAVRLGERFRLLTGGRRTAVERHQTLRATVDWSYSLLGETERIVFERLGVFAGGFDTTAVESVAEGDGVEAWDVVDAVAGLVDKSMLVDEETFGGATRYRVLETLRQYAIERLAEGADVDHWRRQHAQHYAGVAEAIGPLLIGSEHLLGRARVLVELDNLRAAVTWGLEREDVDDIELALRIVGALSTEAYHDPSLPVGAWAQQAVERVDATDPALRAIVLGAAASCAMTRGDYERAQVLGRAAIAEGASRNWHLMSSAFASLAFSNVVAGQYDEGIAILTEAEQLLRATEDAELFDLVGVLNSLAAFRAMNPDDPEALPCAEETVRVSRELGNARLLAQALYALGWALERSEPDTGLAALEESLELMGASDVRFALYGSVAAMTAHARARAGDPSGALEALGAAFRHYREMPDLPQLVASVDHALRIFARLGDFEAAPCLLGVTIDGPLARLNNFPGTITDASPLVERVRSEVGDDDYRAARARGAAMTHEQVVAYVLSEIDRVEAERDA